MNEGRTATVSKGYEQGIDQYRIAQEPFYADVRGEVGLFTIAAKSRMPVMLKGPTGCGKTRFVQHMAYRLGRPLITVACHEDLTASDLVGRYLLKGQETVWMDGPLTLGVKQGAIVYLDEIVEARKDTTVIIHPLSDDRRLLPIEKKGQVIEAVVAHEAGVSAEIAQRLVKIAEKVRNLKNHGLEEGVSTRLLIYAATLIKQGVPAERACDVALARPITDDPDMLRSIVEVVKAVF